MHQVSVPSRGYEMGVSVEIGVSVRECGVSRNLMSSFEDGVTDGARFDELSLMRCTAKRTKPRFSWYPRLSWRQRLSWCPLTTPRHNSSPSGGQERSICSSAHSLRISMKGFVARAVKRPSNQEQSKFQREYVGLKILKPRAGGKSKAYVRISKVTR
jgi:hypothetical protein